MNNRVNFNGYDCEVVRSQYANGRVALILKSQGETVVIATVNLPESPCEPDEVFIKDYSENSGVRSLLESAGVIRWTGETVRSGYVVIPKAKLLPETP